MVQKHQLLWKIDHQCIVKDGLLCFPTDHQLGSNRCLLGISEMGTVKGKVTVNDKLASRTLQTN